MKKILLCLLGLVLTGSLLAQETFPRNGVYDDREGLYAFTNATIYTSYNKKVENATLVIRDGKIEAVGVGVAVPKGAIEFDCEGKFIYPSFIDLYHNYGTPKPKAEGTRPRSQPQMLSNKKGAYSWNEALKPEFNAAEAFKVDGKSTKGLRGLGFGTVLTHRMDGIHRGTAALVTLADDREHEVMLTTKAADVLSFNKGTSTQNYPSSLMGGIALLRQTYLDADWYAKTGYKKEQNLSLQAWNDNMKLPHIFVVRDRLEALRAAKIGKEFGQQYIFKGDGDEYQRINELKATGAAFIIPLSFPIAYDVEDPFAALQVELADMKHWELAPTNAARLAKAGIDFAITSNGVKDRDFWKNFRIAVKNGLSEEDALKALTATPARLIGASDRLGSLEKGKIANFLITSDNIFDDKAKIHHNWVQGKGYVISSLHKKDITGNYDFKLGDKAYTLNVADKAYIPTSDSTKVEVKHSIKGDVITLSFNLAGEKGKVTSLTGTVKDGKMMGNGTDPEGNWLSWSATKISDAEKKEKKDKEKKTEEVTHGEVVYPFLSYGNKELPTAKTYLIKNATVWTNEAVGIMENADVLIRDGKIIQVGKNLTANNAIEIDGTGKHVTPGIIDEHSHIAISRGVNEGSQYSSAEVSIADVVDSEDINIYRQLSGGVTMSQLLHGSANPIGGQSALIKLKFGYQPEEMKVTGADPFIKFALGENVKQSNWGDDNRSRYPQTRMGVEQVFEDHFTRARAYGEALKKDPTTRRDLELEALLEILNSERFITCHSYVQSEINMLMKVAERHGFKVNTFTHILEGYKVADKMAKHGAGGSTFSDWWAYKYEVLDAIPQNAAIMQEAGVVVAINSDDREMARRLNQEAGKSVMYGGMNQEDALKLVTLNPAKLLHVDNRTGSLKEGKDADVVIWSANPLSIYAKAEMTFVDGIKFFDRKEDLKKREEIKAERARLTQKMLAAKKNGAKTKPVKIKADKHYHCDTLFDELR